MNLHEVALLLFDKALELEPNDVSTRYVKNTTLLQMGHLERGWQDFNVRFEKFEEARAIWRPEPPVYWDGEDVNGKRILLWGEQGVGEQILSMSVLNNLLDAGGTYFFECEGRLVPVFKRSFPGVEIIPYDMHSDFLEKSKLPIDYQAPSLNMLKYLAKSVEDIPRQQSYLKPDMKLRKELRQKYESMAQGKRIVGISWRSASVKLERHKSADLMDWHPIIGHPDVFVVNLQYGDYQDEVRSYEERFGSSLYDDTSIDPMSSVDQAMAQIAAMDLVVSISNSNAHIGCHGYTHMVDTP